MALGNLLARLFGDKGLDVDELARRLGMAADDLRKTQPGYKEFNVPKRAGGARRICAPDRPLKIVQRRILKRLLSRLCAHPAAMGFERGRSIVTNALPHAGKAVVLRMDLRDFFGATAERRVRDYFRRIGWNREAADMLTRLTTHKGGLPQGAPTSPRLSNLANHGIDARLVGLARKFGAAYTRYADDITFSFPADDPPAVRAVIRATKKVVGQVGYALHQKRKLHVRRAHQRQVVTGLVVNHSANLPRETRRRLRAVEHHLANGREATLTAAQLEGWRALQDMVRRQTRA
jgi:RNA-directed DNA polymerase